MVARGGMRGFFDEIQSMSGQYASYWNAFLFVECVSTSTKKVVHTCTRFFVDVLAHYKKNIHYLWNQPVHLQKSSTYTSF